MNSTVPEFIHAHADTQALDRETLRPCRLSCAVHSPGRRALPLYSPGSTIHLFALLSTLSFSLGCLPVVPPDYSEHPAMSGASRDGGGSGSSDLQLVAVASKSEALSDALAAGAGGGHDGAIVEYTKSGPLLREDEEDLEVKLRRIMENVPVRVSNTSGSSAGSGSGDFHQYRQMRRKEQDRLMRMDADYQKRKEIAEFNIRRGERLKAAEERTAKKRQKRQRKKQRKKEKKNRPDIGAGGQCAGKEESSDGDDEDSDDVELKK